MESQLCSRLNWATLWIHRTGCFGWAENGCWLGLEESDIPIFDFMIIWLILVQLISLASEGLLQNKDWFKKWVCASPVLWNCHIFCKGCTRLWEWFGSLQFHVQLRAQRICLSIVYHCLSFGWPSIIIVSCFTSQMTWPFLNSRVT